MGFFVWLCFFLLLIYVSHGGYDKTSVDIKEAFIFSTERHL